MSPVSNSGVEFLKYLFLFMCVAYVSFRVPRVSGSPLKRRLEEGVWSPGAGITGSCAMPDMGAGN